MKPQLNEINSSLDKVVIEKVVFLGTPEFAVPTLELLAQSKYKPRLVITQPDTKQGRNMRLTAPPVKQKAIEYGIETMQPENINEEYVVDRIAYLEPDIIITVAYGGILKTELLQVSKYGCINLHPSLLPKYRGSSPVNYTLFNGDKKTGNSIIKMVRKMDSGPVLRRSFMNVDDDDNTSSLLEKLAVQGAEDIYNTLLLIEEGKVIEEEQNEDEATYSKKITKADALINWNQESRLIRARIKGLAEDPGAFTFLRGQRMKVLKTELLKKKTVRPAGTIILAGDLSSYDKDITKKGIVVTTGDKDLLITEVQPAGKRAMTAFEFQLGAKIKPYERFTNEH